MNIMNQQSPEKQRRELAEQVLGYLNFASGTDQAAPFYRRVDQLDRLEPWQTPGEADESPDDHSATSAKTSRARRLLTFLDQELDRLKSESGHFKDDTQARSILKLTEHLLDNFWEFHQDLLFHQTEDRIFNSYLTARALLAVMEQQPPWDERERIVAGALTSLNDYLGYRPVAVLETQKIEPYPNEWVAPIPVYIAGVGVAHGPYQEVVQQAIAFLQEADPGILREACFDPERLKQLCVDPRAYDFDHPAYRRPNHQFGQWDEHTISRDGYYERFVVQQVTLDALMDRVWNPQAEDARLSRKDRIVEAGAVLAGVILMGSGISGHGPGTYSSETSLRNLLPIIANYRDQFYEQLIEQLPSRHSKRLKTEAKRRQQPFGAARQHLNSRLANMRAQQLVNCRLAKIFAQMGYADEAENQTRVVPAASARILCQIDCRISTAIQATKRRDLERAFDQIPEIVSLLRRGIACGAIVDPWNILGFQANFSVFPHHSNTTPDHRCYELVSLVERIMDVCSQLWAEAAAIDNREMCDAVKAEFRSIVEWWFQFAAHEVMDVEAVDPHEVFNAAQLVARALNLWHRGGAATGDIAFWAEHAGMFDSPKAYGLVIDALMQRDDYQTASALMVHWLSQAADVALQQGDCSFHDLVWRFAVHLRDELIQSQGDAREQIWTRLRKFHDYLEANAEHYWEVPTFQLGRSQSVSESSAEASERDDASDDAANEDGGLYDAAYEDVVYRDTTDDGMESSLFDPHSAGAGDDELEAEIDRVWDRLEFLETIAGFWRIGATAPLPVELSQPVDSGTRDTLAKRRAILETWRAQAVRNQSGLETLMESVFQYPLPAETADFDAMETYDRMRVMRDTLLERIVNIAVETADAIRAIDGCLTAIDRVLDDTPSKTESRSPDQMLTQMIAAIMLRDRDGVRRWLFEWIFECGQQTLLYIPLARGGHPSEMVQTRIRQSVMLELLNALPALGLLSETFELTRTALAMERKLPPGRGAVSEFDELFQEAFSSAVNCLVDATESFQRSRIEEGVDESDARSEADSVLFDAIEIFTEAMLGMWLSHSRSLRLSVVEKIASKREWEKISDFIERYGHGILTQYFLSMSSLRAILHRGVDTWLQEVATSGQFDDLPLFRDLGTKLPLREACDHLTTIFEAVVEHFNEYRDYNGTTTQSDRGELFHIFLDFLRLQCRYDRVAWNLKPVVWAHEVLIRRGRGGVARMWRRSLNERVGPEAERFLKRMNQLRKKYSVQLDTVARRLEERFITPLQIDRLRSLVGRAMADPADRECQRTFEKLRNETQAFCRATQAVGMDLPSWLAALENEVHKNLLPLRLKARVEGHRWVDVHPVSLSEVFEQLEQMPRPSEES